MLAAAMLLLAAPAAVVVAYFLWLAAARPRPSAAAKPVKLPPILVVVPTYEEAAVIERKLQNLRQLTYAGPWRAVVVDGGSTDGTADIVDRAIAADANLTLLETSHRNKMLQLHEALAADAGADWVLVTDADALLPADTLERLMEVAQSDPTVGVVGTRVRPAAAHELESLHWRATDWLRDREYRRGSAGIVAAPCYLVARDLVGELPRDATADDVFVASRAMASGRRVAHSTVIVRELRSPRTLWALWRHKLRKAHGYQQEVLRFRRQLRQFAPPLRAIFLVRALLLTVLPCCAIAGAAALLLTVWPSWLAGLALVFRPVRLAALLVVVSAVSCVAYPFATRTASFPKISECEQQHAARST